MEEMWYRFKLFLFKLAYFKSRGRLRRYGLAPLLILLFFPLMINLPSHYFQLINSQTLSLLVFTLIVTISSWYGGAGPGIFATFLTATISYFTILRKDIAYHPITGDLFIVFVFIIAGIVIAAISEARYEMELQKDEFIGFASHELKTPLTVIKGFTDMLRGYCQRNGNRKVSKYVEEIGIQSDKLLELISDLLDTTKIEVGNFVYRDELFDFDNLVKEVVNHQRIINNKRVITLSGNCKKIINGDRYRIGQVMSNLLTNAVKYSPQKEPIEIRIKKDQRNVILTVKDHGVGIPRKEQKNIFNQYYRTRMILRSKAEGLGLGLYICKSIVGRHKGKIWVKSDGERGSTFFMTLPVTHS